MAEFNLNNLYRNTFGYVKPPFPAGGVPSLESIVGRRIPGLRQTGMLGREIRMPMSIRVPGGAAYMLPNEPIVSITGGFDVATTQVNRGKRRGTVKEIVTLNDYRLSVRGIIYNKEEHPAEEVLQIRSILENGIIEVDCYMGNLFDINVCVVESFSWPRWEKKSFRQQNYELTLISDEDFEIDLI